MGELSCEDRSAYLLMNLLFTDRNFVDEGSAANQFPVIGHSVSVQKICNNLIL